MLLAQQVVWPRVVWQHVWDMEAWMRAPAWVPTPCPWGPSPPDLVHVNAHAVSSSVLCPPPPQDFFSHLPTMVAAHLRPEPFIPTRSGRLASPLR